MLGLTWKNEPDLWGPMINHLKIQSDTQHLLQYDAAQTRDCLELMQQCWGRQRNVGVNMEGNPGGGGDTWGRAL